MAESTLDVSSLLMSHFSGGPDEYGHDLVPPLPLRLDVALESRQPASDATLLTLPADFLARLVDLLPPDALDNLAYVNSDCRQLVRTRRFASVHLDYSNRTFSLISALVNEAKERNNSNDGLTKRPAIGSCIRRITVVTDSQAFVEHHMLDNWAESADRELTRVKMDRASVFYFGNYLKRIEAVLTDLPQLQLLDWEDMIALPWSLYSAIMASSVQHLKLYRIPANKTFDLQVPAEIEATGWMLRSLHLELQGFLDDGSKDTATKLCAKVLRLCAPHLLSLVWMCDFMRGKNVSFGSDAVVFPRLQNLDLGSHGAFDKSVLRALIPPNSVLRSLVAEINVEPFMDQYLAQYGPLPSLETLVWQIFGNQTSESLGFLGKNPQIQKLDLPYAAEADFLDQSLLPLLSKSFGSLRSLRLAWQDPHISTRALESISSITSLQQLCLSAGEQFGWRTNWRINHKVLRKYLAKLPHLKKLALRRDSYPERTPDPDDEGDEASNEIAVDHYYDSNHAPQDEIESLLQSTVMRSLHTNAGDGEYMHNAQIALRRVNELVHRRRMLLEAGKYAKTLKKLEWIYIGQLPMVVTESLWGGGHAISRRAMALTDERDSCYSLLKRIFGADDAKFEVVK